MLRRRIVGLAVALAAVVLAPACSQLERLHDMPEQDRLLARGWAKPTSVLAEPQYCYATLAAADCSPYPLPLEAYRREGYPNPGD